MSWADAWSRVEHGPWWHDTLTLWVGRRQGLVKDGVLQQLEVAAHLAYCVLLEHHLPVIGAGAADYCEARHLLM